MGADKTTKAKRLETEIKHNASINHFILALYLANLALLSFLLRINKLKLKLLMKVSNSAVLI